MSLSVLKNKDPKEALKLLSDASKYLLPNSGIAKSFEQSEQEIKDIDLIFREIKQQLQISDDDFSSSTLSKIFEFLSHEISSVALADVDVNNIKERLDNKNELSNDDLNFRVKDTDKMKFIPRLQKYFSDDEDFLDLYKNSEFSGFNIIGLRATTLFLEFVAFVKADTFSEMEITALRDRFFKLTRILPAEFNLKPRGRNPNGLLCFVFEDGCSKTLADFIQKQSKAAHWTESGVIVSWAIDVKNKKIYTHNNPVSLFPPVVILASSVYPGFELLQSLLDESEEIMTDEIIHKIERFLVTLYLMADKRVERDIERQEIFDVIGIRYEEISEIIRYLANNGLVSYKNNTWISITYKGKIEAEKIMQDTYAEREYRVLRAIYEMANRIPEEWVLIDDLEKAVEMSFQELNPILIDLEKRKNLIGSVEQAVWILPAGIEQIEKTETKPEQPTNYFPANIYNTFNAPVIGVQQGGQNNTQNNVQNINPDFTKAINELLILIENSSLSTVQKINAKSDIQLIRDLADLEQTTEVKDLAHSKIESIKDVIATTADMTSLGMVVIPIIQAVFQ